MPKQLLDFITIYLLMLGKIKPILFKLRPTYKELKIKKSAKILKSVVNNEEVKEIIKKIEEKAKKQREFIKIQTDKIESYISKELNKSDMANYDKKISFLINNEVSLDEKLIRWYIDCYLPKIQDPTLKFLALEYLGYKNYGKAQKSDTLDTNENFNRKKAEEYAERFAIKPNKNSYPYYEDADCANFISQVLKAGGISEVGFSKWDDYNSWFCSTTNEYDLEKVAITWRSARYFRRHWGNEDGIGRNRAYRYAEMTVKEALNNFYILYTTLWPGDVIQYDFDCDGYTDHTQVVHDYGYNLRYNTYDLHVAQHSDNKKNVSLYEMLLNLPDNSSIFIYKIKKGM